MIRLLLIIICTASLIQQTAQSSAKGAENRVSSYEKLIEEEALSTKTLNLDLHDELIKTLDLAVSTKNADGFDSAYAAQDEATNRIISKLKESHLRLIFLNSFIGSVEHSTDPRSDSIKALVTLAERQITSSSETETELGTLWKFETNLAIAIKKCLEPDESLLDFVSQYLHFSEKSVTDPFSPFKFCLNASRAYRN
jgi:hypothetical protein